MKKLIFSLSILLCGFHSQAQTEILNGGFENWDSTSINGSPDSWLGFNIDTFLVFGMDTMELVAETVSKVTDSHSGDYAVKLSADTIFGDEVPGFLYYIGSSEEGFNFFMEEGESQMPLQAVGAEVNSIYGYYKFFPSGVDTAVLIIGYADSIGGMEEPDYLFSDTITDTVATFTQFALEVSEGISVDSFLLGFMSGNNQGSYLILDDISLEENIGIIEHENSAVKILQNLENSDLRIVAEQAFSNATVRIISLQGKVVWTDEMNGKEKQISVQELSKGVYVLQIGDRLNPMNGQKVIIK